MDIFNLSVSTVPISQSVRYSCTLHNTWSGATHPIDYVSVTDNAHWSPPVLVSHSPSVDLWSPGDMASPGIESVAEMGTTATLEQELEVLQTKGLAGGWTIGQNQFNNADPPQKLADIKLSPSHPYLSSISMMAPSPDWFSGFDSFSPRGPGGYWFETFELATYPFDAGTEEGSTYTINNEASSPHGPIYPLIKDTVPASGILKDPTGTTVFPVLTWSCSRVADASMGASDVQMSKESGMMSDMSKESSMMADMSKESSMMMAEMDPNGGFRGLRGN